MIKFQDFFTEATKKFNNKFLYDENSYRSITKKTTIICPTHGSFETVALSHLKTSHGCDKCFIDSKRDTTESFIVKATSIHGDTYDYSKTVYSGSTDFVRITCKDHGEFEQRARDHLSGNGCPVCGYYKKRLSLKEIVIRAREKHGDKYDYSLITDETTNERVTIICPTHGEFRQKLSAHLFGYGCSLCWKEKHYLTSDIFIERSNKVHSGKYDYSKVVYVNNTAHVTIVCPVHGEYRQSPSSHMKGVGCKRCTRVYDTEGFVKKAKKVHGELYTYENSKYTGADSDIEITCPKHGKFTQTPSNHLRGKRCQYCRSSRGEEVIKEILEEYDIEYIRQYSVPEAKNRLRYDFYLPDRRILLEYHGIQHYQYVPFFHRNGEDDFLKQKNRDDLIRYIAKVNKYRYIEISYRQLERTTEDEFRRLLLQQVNGPR